jgi:hypothetical protein
VFYISAILVSLLMSEELSYAEKISFKTKVKIFFLIILLYAIFSMAIIINDLKKYILDQIKCFYKK